MEGYDTESSGSWKGVIILAVIAVCLLLLIVNDVPGRFADAATARAQAVIAHEETQRQRDYLAYLASQHDSEWLPFVVGAAGLAVGYYAGRQVVKGA